MILIRLCTCTSTVKLLEKNDTVRRGVCSVETMSTGSCTVDSLSVRYRFCANPIITNNLSHISNSHRIPPMIIMDQAFTVGVFTRAEFVWTGSCHYFNFTAEFFPSLFYSCVFCYWNVGMWLLRIRLISIFIF